MGLKGYRLWVMGQLVDSNVQSPAAVDFRDDVREGFPLGGVARRRRRVPLPRVGLSLTPGVRLVILAVIN
jgi:hypothetical protein